VFEEHTRARVCASNMSWVCDKQCFMSYVCDKQCFQAHMSLDNWSSLDSKPAHKGTSREVSEKGFLLRIHWSHRTHMCMDTRLEATWEVISHHQVKHVEGDFSPSGRRIQSSSHIHKDESNQTYTWYMWCIWTRHAPPVSALSHRYECIVLHVWTSFVKRMKESYVTCERFTSCVWLCHFSHLHEVCPIISHTWKRSLKHNQCVPFLYACVYVRKECVLVHRVSCNIFRSTIRVYYWVMHATCCSVLQRTATCCSMLQRVAVYCWVLQTARLFQNCLRIPF